MGTRVFVIVEEVFRAITPLTSKRIDVENIKNIVLRHPMAISLYESLIQSSTTEELKYKILTKYNYVIYSCLVILVGKMCGK